jgi:peptide chain release factor 2
LEQKISSPEFWDDPQNAQRLSKQAASLRNEVESWKFFQRRIKDALELARMNDETLRPELEVEITALENEMEAHSFSAMLSGKYDEDDAILAIHAGAGGTDSQDWAQMLQRMFLRWADSKGFETEIIDTTEGEEAGIKSSTIAINGRYAFGICGLKKGCIDW